MKKLITSLLITMSASSAFAGQLPPNVQDWMWDRAIEADPVPAAVLQSSAAFGVPQHVIAEKLKDVYGLAVATEYFQFHYNSAPRCIPNFNDYC